jgi:hypothetical protein
MSLGRATGRLKGEISSEKPVSSMKHALETLGNATLVFYENGRPVLATDPWLEGRCYSGSWALERKLTDCEREAVLSAEYIWISHGHPDHFHIPSLASLPRGKKILLPDHYAPDIWNFLVGQGFDVEIMPYRTWRQLSPGVRCLCLDNENQDAILIVEAGDSLMVNLNDSPLCGDAGFIRSLVARHDRAKTYMAALCSNDADMMNFVDADGARTIDTPAQRKPGMVWSRGRIAQRLGVGNYVSSASQHIYARSDSVWANPYRVSWKDFTENWREPDIRIIEPFVVLDLDNGGYARKHPTQATDPGQIAMDMNGDEWEEHMTEPEWSNVFAFFRRLELLKPHLDYLEFTVGGETRRLWINEDASTTAPGKLRGIRFEAPRRSLLKSIQHGYFDDMLIGNFMKTQLHNVTLYPHFTPIVAKLRGSSGVATKADARKFKRRYFRRNPLGYFEWRAEQRLEAAVDWLRVASEKVGLKRPLKRLYRRVLGDPYSGL